MKIKFCCSLYKTLSLKLNICHMRLLTTTLKYFHNFGTTLFVAENYTLATLLVQSKSGSAPRSTEDRPYIDISARFCLN